MPFCPTGQVFCLECNVIVFATKLVDRIYFLKIRVKYFLKIPQVPTGQELRPECNVYIFARKLVESIFCGLRNKWKILLKNKQIKKLG